MLSIWVCQAVFGAAALIACARASISALRHDPRMSFQLTLAGAFALIFFITVDGARIEMMLVSLLATVAGMLMMPGERYRSVRDFLDDDLEIGESTASRRLRK